MFNILQVTPFMYVPEIEAAVAFFVDLLEFRVGLRMGDYAYVHRENAGIRLMQNTGDDGAPPGNRRFAYYFDVRDVDRLHAELKAKLDTLPAQDVYGPVDQAYGQRELLILGPDGNLIVFGQALDPVTDAPPERALTITHRGARSSHFEKANLAGSTFTDVNLGASTFNDVRLSQASFHNVSLAEAVFSDVDFGAVDISQSRVAGMRIDGVLVTDLLAAYRADPL
jgi:catechol 2,3-dioxygenase-like lactoylglutathione lyase family enzyme